MPGEVCAIAAAGEETEQGVKKPLIAPVHRPLLESLAPLFSDAVARDGGESPASGEPCEGRCIGRARMEAGPIRVSRLRDCARDEIAHRQPHGPGRDLSRLARSITKMRNPCILSR